MSEHPLAGNLECQSIRILFYPAWESKELLWEKEWAWVPIDWCGWFWRVSIVYWIDQRYGYGVTHLLSVLFFFTSKFLSLCGEPLIHVSSISIELSDLPLLCILFSCGKIQMLFLDLLVGVLILFLLIFLVIILAFCFLDFSVSNVLFYAIIWLYFLLFDQYQETHVVQSETFTRFT